MFAQFVRFNVQSSDAEPEALKAEEADPLIKELLSDVPDISSDVKDTTGKSQVTLCYRTSLSSMVNSCPCRSEI